MSDTICTVELVTTDFLVNALDMCFKAVGFGDSVTYALKANNLFNTRLAIDFMRYNLGDDYEWYGIEYANAWDFMSTMRDMFNDVYEQEWYYVLIKEFGDMASDVDDRLHKAIRYAIQWCDSIKYHSVTVC